MKRKPRTIRIKAKDYAYLNLRNGIRIIGYLFITPILLSQQFFKDGSDEWIKIILFIVGAFVMGLSIWKLSGVIETHQKEYYK